MLIDHSRYVRGLVGQATATSLHRDAVKYKREQLPTIRVLYLATNESIMNELRNQNTISMLLGSPFDAVCGKRGDTTLGTELQHCNGRIESRGDI